MADILALIAALFFAVAATLQHKGALNLPLSLPVRRPGMWHRHWTARTRAQLHHGGTR